MYKKGLCRNGNSLQAEEKFQKKGKKNVVIALPNSLPEDLSNDTRLQSTVPCL